MTNKVEKAERRKQILAEAIRQAARVGFSNIKREAIAEALKVSPALVSLHFSTMPQLRRDVMRAAVKMSAEGRGGDDSLRVIAQGLAVRDRAAMSANALVRANALSILATA